MKKGSTRHLSGTYAQSVGLWWTAIKSMHRLMCRLLFSLAPQLSSPSSSLITDLLPQLDGVKVLFKLGAPWCFMSTTFTLGSLEETLHLDYLRKLGWPVTIATECFCFSGGLPVLLCSMNPSGIATSLCTSSNVPLCLTSLYGFVKGSWGDLGKNLTIRSSNRQQAL